MSGFADRFIEQGVRQGLRLSRGLTRMDADETRIRILLSAGNISGDTEMGAVNGIVIFSNFLIRVQSALIRG
jgi:hypothetical protein